jgi:hypothetical protein
MNAVEQVLRECQAEVFVVPLVQRDGILRLIAQERHSDLFPRRVEPPVHDVVNRRAVDGQDAITDANARRLRQAAWRDGFNDILRTAALLRGEKFRFMGQYGKAQSHSVLSYHDDLISLSEFRLTYGAIS